MRKIYKIVGRYYQDLLGIKQTCFEVDEHDREEREREGEEKEKEEMKKEREEETHNKVRDGEENDKKKRRLGVFYWDPFLVLLVPE